MITPPCPDAIPLYQLKNVCQSFTTGGTITTVLDAVSIDFFQGETVAIVGASGCGKSTLLHLLGTLASPVSGQIYFEQVELTTLPPAGKASIRNRDIGFIFQFHHMLPEFSTLENVAMQGIVGGMPKREALDRAAQLLEQVGLSQRINHNIALLSGGERQRAAIARAILTRPKVLLADEPTGNLDEKTGRRVAQLLLELNAMQKMTLIIVTHNLELAAKMERRFELKSGDLYDQKR